MVMAADLNTHREDYMTNVRETLCAKEHIVTSMAKRFHVLLLRGYHGRSSVPGQLWQKLQTDIKLKFI